MNVLLLPMTTRVGYGSSLLQPPLSLCVCQAITTYCLSGKGKADWRRRKGLGDEIIGGFSLNGNGPSQRGMQHYTHGLREQFLRQRRSRFLNKDPKPSTALAREKGARECASATQGPSNFTPSPTLLATSRAGRRLLALTRVQRRATFGNLGRETPSFGPAIVECGSLLREELNLTEKKSALSTVTCGSVSV